MGFTRRDYERLSLRSKEVRARAFEAVDRARKERITIRGAFEEQKVLGRPVSMGSIKKYAGDALTKDVFGRLRARPGDRYFRQTEALTKDGLRTVISYGRRGDVQIANAHNSAVRKWRRHGDPSGLPRFEGVRVRAVDPATGHLYSVELETDPVRIDRRDERGELDEIEVGSG